MQKSQASESTTRQLRQWLAHPETAAEPGSGNNTAQDLRWLEGTKDLSSIELGDEEKAPSIREKDFAIEAGGNQGGVGGARSGGGGGGFMSLFSCASKRK